MIKNSKIAEIEKALLSDHPAKDLSEKKELLLYLIPSLKKVIELKPKHKGHFKDIWPHTLRVVQQAKKNKIIRWAAFFHDLGKAETYKEEHGKVSFHNHEIKSAKIFRKFANSCSFFNNNDKEKICFLIRHLGYIESYESEWTDSAVRRFSKEIGNSLEDLVELSKADITTSSMEKRENILKKLEELKTRIEFIRKEDSKKPLLPKGLGFEIINKLNVRSGKNVGDFKDILLERIEKQEIEPYQDCEYYIEFLLKEKLCKT